MKYKFDNEFDDDSEYLEYIMTELNEKVELDSKRLYSNLVKEEIVRLKRINFFRILIDIIIVFCGFILGDYICAEFKYITFGFVFSSMVILSYCLSFIYNFFYSRYSKNWDDFVSIKNINWFFIFLLFFGWLRFTIVCFFSAFNYHYFDWVLFFENNFNSHQGILIINFVEIITIISALIFFHYNNTKTINYFSEHFDELENSLYDRQKQLYFIQQNPYVKAISNWLYNDKYNKESNQTTTEFLDQIRNPTDDLDVHGPYSYEMIRIFNSLNLINEETKISRGGNSEFVPFSNYVNFDKSKYLIDFLNDTDYYFRFSISFFSLFFKRK
jgi:hypothetical protein